MSDRPIPLFAFGEFGNVRLSMAELAKLQERFGDQYQERIDAFSESKAAHGYRYKSDYAAILAWARKDGFVNKDQHGAYKKFVKGTS